MSRGEININSQALFRDYLTKPLLIEFLKRVRSKTLVNDIYNQFIKEDLRSVYPDVTIKTRIVRSIKHEMPDIFVVLTLLTNEKEFAHITYHMIQKKVNDNYGNGPIHIKNTKGAQKRIFIKPLAVKNIAKGIVMSPGSDVIYTKHLSTQTSTLTTAILNTINAYVDPSNTLSLTKPRNAQLGYFDDIEEIANEIIDGNNILKRGRISHVYGGGITRKMKTHASSRGKTRYGFGKSSFRLHSKMGKIM